MIADGGGGFKIRSALANNSVQDEEVSDITPGKLPQRAHMGVIHGPDDRYPFTDSSFQFSTFFLNEIKHQSDPLKFLYRDHG